MNDKVLEYYIESMVRKHVNEVMLSNEKLTTDLCNMNTMLLKKDEKIRKLDKIKVQCEKFRKDLLRYKTDDEIYDE